MGRNIGGLRLLAMYIKNSFAQASVLEVTRPRHWKELFYLKCVNQVGEAGRFQRRRTLQLARVDTTITAGWSDPYHNDVKLNTFGL